MRQPADRSSTTPRPRLARAAAVVVGVVVAAACSGGAETGGAPADRSSQSGTPEVSENAEGLLSDERIAEYLEEAETVAPPESDAAEPAQLPESSGGASGYTRYVFRESDGRVLTSLVEGPTGRQTRCQQTDLPCSYNELKDLAESGDPIPDELDLTRAELEELVSQLDGVAAAVAHYADPNTACAEGFRSDRTQTPNMGSHFSNMSRILDGEFVPSEPEIIMYARPDGVAPDGQLGQCRGGVWEGEELEAVAAAFILFTSETGGDHPDAFAGDFDNWHVHYNLCRGAGVDSIAPEDVCRAAGGTYYQSLGWMMHAWVSPDQDNDLGVFSMWNPTLWPVSDTKATAARATARPPSLDDDAAFFSITNFSFGRIDATVGNPVVIANTDSVAHTVTEKAKKKRGRFDSGVFAPGESYEIEFDEPGQYPYFCALHPDMQGTIVVR